VFNLKNVSERIKYTLYFRKEIPAGGVLVSIVLTSDCSGAVVQLADGTLFLYKLHQNEMSHHSKSLPEACEQLQVL